MTLHNDISYIVGGKVFNKIYSKRISEKDETLLSNWDRVREHLKANTSAINDVELLVSLSGRSGMKRRSDIRYIENMIQNEIPELRRRAAPRFNR